MATNETNKLIFGTTTYNLKDDSGTASSHTHTKSQITDFPTSMTPSNDSNLVHKTGNESIGGNKTFDGDIIINDSDDNNRKSIKFITSESSVPQIQANGNSLNFENADDYDFDGEVYIDNTTHINGELLVNHLGCNNGNFVDLYADIDLDGQGIVGPKYYFNFSPYNSYEVGDYCYHDSIYKCTTAHTGAWNSSHFKKVSNSILLGGDICLNNDLIITSDGLNSDSTISITTDSDIELTGTTYNYGDFNCYGPIDLNGNNLNSCDEIYANRIYTDEISADDTNYISLITSLKILEDAVDIIIDTNNCDGNIAVVDVFSTNKAYSVGNYVTHNGVLYKCTTAHSAAAWNSSHFTRCTNLIVSNNDIIGKTFEATGSDYAEKFETLEDCPACRFVTLDGEKIKLAQPEDDYILGITSELPSIIGDKMNQGTPVGLLGKLWVECDDTVKVNSFVTSGKDGIATKSDKGYRVMAVDGNKCKVLVK